MGNYLPVTIPIVWAFVATVLGLALYRTSHAYFEKKQTSKSTSVGLSLTGSVVIAGVVFYGLAKVTPREWLARVPSDERVVREADLIAIRDLATEIDRQSMEMQGCTTAAGVLCSNEIEQIRNRSAALASRVNTILKADQLTNGEK